MYFGSTWNQWVGIRLGSKKCCRAKFGKQHWADVIRQDAVLTGEKSILLKSQSVRCRCNSKLLNSHFFLDRKGVISLCFVSLIAYCFLFLERIFHRKRLWPFSSEGSLACATPTVIRDIRFYGHLRGPVTLTLIVAEHLIGSETVTTCFIAGVPCPLYMTYFLSK